MFGAVEEDVFCDNRNVQTSNIHSNFSIKAEVDDETSTDSNANIRLKSIYLNGSIKVKDDESLNHEQTFSLQAICSKESENIVTSPGETDNIQTTIDERDAPLNVISNEQDVTLQMSGFREENREERTDGNDNIQANTEMDPLMEQDVESTSRDTSNHHNNMIPLSGDAKNNSRDQQVENEVATTDANDRIRISTTQPNHFTEHEIIAPLSHHNDITQSSSDGQQQVENEEKACEANDAHKDGDIDPNTQITHLEIDSSNKDRPQQKRFDSQPFLFLIQHIHNITWPNQDEECFAPEMHLFGQTFSTVMVYGTVTSLNVDNGGLTQRFVIDDGSGAINVLWKADRRNLDLVKTLHSLDNEVKQCRQSGLALLNENWHPKSGECKEMLDDFNQIIEYCKRNVTKRTKLKLFGYAAVVGKTFRQPGKGVTQLYATHIQDDSGVDRSLELYFKKNLIRLYEEKYMVDR